MKKDSFSLVRQEYLFGDHNLAARRLAKLHEVFAASSRELLTGLACGSPKLAVDLGCGVGHTTEMLRRAVKPLKTVGVDISEPFLERALSKYRLCNFAKADIRSGLPLLKPDLLYGRYILCHLTPYDSTLNGLKIELAEEGLLVLEENSDFYSDEPVLTDYMAAVGELMHLQGQDLFLGKSLKKLIEGLGGGVVEEKQVSVSPTIETAVELFLMNFPSWKEKAHQVRTAQELNEIEGGLSALARGEVSESKKVAWEITQISAKFS